MIEKLFNESRHNRNDAITRGYVMLYNDITTHYSNTYTRVYLVVS